MWADKQSAHSRRSRLVVQFLETRWWHALMIAMLMFVLFVPDVIALTDATNAVDPAINALLLLCMATFLGELVANIACRPGYTVLEAFMDLVAGALIVVDTTWVQAAILAHATSAQYTLTRAVVLASRAGRLARLMRHLNLLQGLQAVIDLFRKLLRRQKQDRGLDMVALLIMVTLTLFPILQRTIPESYQAPNAMVAVLAPLVGQPRSQLDPLVASFFQFFDAQRKQVGMPMRLLVGAEEWVVPGSAKHRPRWQDLQWVASKDGLVRIEMNIEAQTRGQAWLSILLAVFVIAELTVFIGVLNETAVALLVAPLARILTVLRTQAARVMKSMERSEEETELGLMEAVVTKMSRIIAHVGSQSEQGAQILSSIQTKHAADEGTQEWLRSVMSARHHAAPPRQRRQSVESARMVTLLRKVSLYGDPDGTSAATQESLSVQDQAALEAEMGASPQVARRLAAAEVDSAVLDSWDWDVFQYTPEQLVPHVLVMFMRLGLTQHEADSFSGLRSDSTNSTASQASALAEAEAAAAQVTDGLFLDLDTLWTFVQEVRKAYREVPYHNFFHCVDVTHATYRFIALVGRAVGLSQAERLALMLAALCHDMEHPGVNNAYLVNVRHDLALVYNDASVLENRHLAAMYGLLAGLPEADVLAALEPARWRELRRLVINAVIHTDMVHHFPMVSKIEVFYELNAAAIQSAARGGDDVHSVISADDGDGGTSTPAGGCVFRTAEERAMLVAMLLHCADISNASKPRHIAEKWSVRVLEEFFAQGDRERAAGLPVSPMMDRAATSHALSQINFIEFIVAPLFSQVVRVLPELRPTMQFLWENRRAWNDCYLVELANDRAKSPADKDTERVKLGARWTAFHEKYKQQILVQAMRLSDAVVTRRESGSMKPRVSSGSDTARPHALNRVLRKRPSGGTQPGADLLSVAEQGEAGAALAHSLMSQADLQASISESTPGDPLVQYVVLRRDLWSELGWPLGSVVAQACHAATAALWLSREQPETATYCAADFIDHMHKVVLEVKGEAQLRTLAEKLAAASVRHKLWVEQPEGFPTCVATAPYPKAAVQQHFKKLKLCKGA
ncbi:hypothetical protein WJX81_001157 [Elliptochloris bilobata]|uniref:Phosphodiesterase n=1 Tax=Elliptochloris bilobata TaxID=381761 RepID=A0AAW1RCP1_9CHLO